MFGLFLWGQRMEDSTRNSYWLQIFLIAVHTPWYLFLFHNIFSQSVINKLDNPILGMQVCYLFSLTILV